uniref:Uncharacterized protein n=1 Tax=viral metagenome TaxID=1070528 RepID=A0A6C0B6U7_9ZZZZ
MEGYIRFDFLFSYWIFIWFVLYYNIYEFKGTVVLWIKKTASPLLALWTAFWFNVYEIIYLSLIKLNIVLIIKYIFMILIVKALPIYLLYRKGITINWINDLTVLFIISLVYILYLHANEENPLKIYEETEKSLIKGDNKTPIFSLFEKLNQLIH